MMSDSGVSRRGFIRTFTGGAVGGMMLYAFPPGARARYVLGKDETIAADDDQVWNVVRDQFPLRREPLFLNNGTIGPSPYVVIDSVRNEMEEVERGARYGGWETARPKIANFANAEVEEISLTHNVTEGINIVASGLPLKTGDEIILTNHEHAGNAVPWLARARRDGLVIKELVLPRTHSDVLNRINDLISTRTRVIAVPHITCTTGQVLPAKEIAALGHGKGLWVMIDGAHTPGMMPLDVKAMGCDFFASCGHKWMMGPKGTGFLYVRKEMLEVLQPMWTGALADAGWDVGKGTVEYRKDAHRFDFATQNSAIYVGLGAAVDFLHHLGMENVARRGRALATRLREGLLQFGKDIEILTPDEEGGFGSVIGFRMKHHPYDTLRQTLAEKYKIVTRAVGENGLNSNRVSTHVYNSVDEVDRFLTAMREIVSS